MTLLDSSHHINVPWYVGVPVFAIGIILFIGGGLWVLLTLNKRVEKAIKKEAASKGFDIVHFQETYWNADCPFNAIDLSIGSSSRIFGFSGERNYFRIITCKQYNEEVKYWVKVRTSFFMPSSIQIKKLN